MQADGPDGFENNEALVAQALRDSAAFGSVVILYYRMVFSVAYAYLQDPEAAEELTQETFLRAFLHLDKLREPRTLPAWLNRIARNESLKWIEKRQVRSRLMPTVPLEAIPMNLADEEQPTPCQQAETQDERAGIRESLSRLPADVREVVVMHYIENVGKSEIARRLNLHPSSVGRKLTRGLEQLRNDAAVSELRGYAPRLTSRAQAASAAIAAVAALPAGTRAALAAKCADSGILAAVMPAPVSSGGIVGALTGSTIAKTLVAVVSVGVIAGAMVHFGGRHTPRESRDARGPRQTGAPGIHPNRSTGRPPTPATRRAAARQTGHGPASAPIVARAHSTTGSVAIIPGGEPDPEYLEGRVIDLAGSPVAYALVDVRTQIPGHETHTDTEGCFRIEGITERKVDVMIIREGYSPFYEPQQPLGTMASPVVLGHKTAVEGVVTDEVGAPLAGLTVKAVMRPHDGHGVFLKDITLDGTTDRNGRYRIALPPEEYTLEARKGDAVARTKVAVAADNTCFANLRLRIGLTLRARVIDGITSEPIPGAKVWSTEKSGVSNTSGVLEIHGLSAGNKEFYFKKDGYARFWSEDSQSGRYVIETGGWHFETPYMVFAVAENAQAVTIVAEKGARIRGTVLDPDQRPIEDVPVSMIHSGSRSNLGAASGLYESRTDMSGRFELLLPASKSASFRLVACDMGKNHSRSRQRWADAQVDGLVTQPGQELDGIVLRLARPGTIRGQLVPPDGEPAPARRTRVAVQADWPGLRRYMWVPEATVDAEG